MVPGVVARVLLGYPGWLLRCCYAVARVPEVVAKVLLCGCYGSWGGFKGVAMQLLKYPGWLLGCCLGTRGGC